MRGNEISISPVETYKFRVRDYADGNLVRKLKESARLLHNYTIKNCALIAAGKTKQNGGFPGIQSIIRTPDGHTKSNFRRVLDQFNKTKVEFGGAQMISNRVFQTVVVIPTPPEKHYWPAYEED